MKRISDIFKDKPRTFSFEFFPPKTQDAYEKLLETIRAMVRLQPDFISCTYGAGGGSRDRTLEIVTHIQNNFQIPAMHHFTCVVHTKDEIKSIIDRIKAAGICNVLALRGDPPVDQPDWKPTEHNFRYSSELVAFLRKYYGDFFAIGVAGFPEGHVLCPDREQDARYLKMKTDAGADFVITQLFFENQDYFDYVQRLRKLGVTARVIPGVLPIVDYPALLRFCGRCGATVPPKVHEIFKPIQDDKDKTLSAGIQFALAQCRELLAGGAPGIHFYTLNKLHPVDAILKEIRK